MISSYNSLKTFLIADCNSVGKHCSFKTYLSDPIRRYLFLLRVLEYLHNTKSSKLIAIPFRVARRNLGIRLGFSIPLNVLGPGAAIVHYGLLVINPDAQIGANCRIHAGVNIGASGMLRQKDDHRKSAPTIGDRCYIGPGAKLYGNIVIASDCVIGANAVVNKSFIKSGVTIAGVPAVVVSTSSSKGMLQG